MLPKITEIQFEEVIEEQELPTANSGKSFLFSFETGEFVLKDGKMIEIQGKEALKQWIKKVIHTARGRYEAYKESSDFGVTVDDLIGSNYPVDFIKKEIENELKSTLLQNEEIISLSNFKAEKNDSKLFISFTVNSIYDSFTEEVLLDE